MPTGYTAGVESGTIESFPEFAMTCARGFGALVNMRDHALETPITDELVVTDDNYHREGFTKAVLELADVNSWSAEQAEAEAEKSYQRQVKNYLLSIREDREHARRYGVMLLQVESWQPPTEDHAGLKNFMREQLEVSLPSGTREREHPVRQSGEQYRLDRVEAATWSLNYHKQHLEETKDRNEDRLDWVHALQDSLTGWQPVEPQRRQLP